MSEETKEEVKAVETSTLQDKVGKLEKQLVELKDTTQAKLDLLKGKVQSLHAKNMELLAKAKENALAAKEKVVGFAPIAWIKSKFKKVKKNKSYVYYRSGDDTGIIKGYVSYAKAGLVRIEDAETISYGIDDMEHAEYISIAIVPFSSISIIKGE
jgi:hypothetical protein